MESGGRDDGLGSSWVAPEEVNVSDIKVTGEDTETLQGVDRTRFRPAVTIVIHSWATPIVGALMLVVGLLGGYFARPLLAPQSPAIVASPSTGAASSSDVSASPQNQTSDPKELMAFVVSQTRHFKGDPNAPVTMIEFSDFQ